MWHSARDAWRDISFSSFCNLHYRTINPEAAALSLKTSLHFLQHVQNIPPNAPNNRQLLRTRDATRVTGFRSSCQTKCFRWSVNWKGSIKNNHVESTPIVSPEGVMLEISSRQTNCQTAGYTIMIKWDFFQFIFLLRKPKAISCKKTQDVQLW